MLSASLILLVLMGSRQAQGLFLSPINTATQIGIVPLSLALALGHFFWGFIQPIAGWIADKYGSRRVLVAG
ncbi:MAG: MFS transporter, partial [Betaproteobacteria bacterium]